MFVKVPHTVMSLGLSSNALKVYLYLSAAKGRRSCIIVRYVTIARCCGICTDTAAAAVKLLEACGLLTIEHRYQQHQYLSNCYRLSAVSGKWFALPLSSAVFALPSAAFGVYLCLCRCANRRGRAFPSYTVISKLLGGRARATVSAGLRLLEQLGLITEMPVWRGRHNLYLVHTKKEGVQPHCCTHLKTRKNSYVFSVSDLRLAVNPCHIASFFSCVQTGSSFFQQHRTDPPSFTIQKRISTQKILWNTQRPPPTA